LEENNTEIDILWIFKIFYKRKLQFIGIFFLSFIFIFGYLQLKPKEYFISEVVTIPNNTIEPITKRFFIKLKKILDKKLSPEKIKLKEIQTNQLKIIIVSTLKNADTSKEILNLLFKQLQEEYQKIINNNLNHMRIALKKSTQIKLLKEEEISLISELIVSKNEKFSDLQIRLFKVQKKMKSNVLLEINHNIENLLHIKNHNINILLISPPQTAPDAIKVTFSTIVKLLIIAILIAFFGILFIENSH